MRAVTIQFFIPSFSVVVAADSSFSITQVEPGVALKEETPKKLKMYSLSRWHCIATTHR